MRFRRISEPSTGGNQNPPETGSQDPRGPGLPRISQSQLDDFSRKAGSYVGEKGRPTKTWKHGLNLHNNILLRTTHISSYIHTCNFFCELVGFLARISDLMMDERSGVYTLDS